MEFGGGSISCTAGATGDRPLIHPQGVDNPTAQIIIAHNPADSVMLTAGIEGDREAARFSLRFWGGSASDRGWTELVATSYTRQDPYRKTTLRVDVRGSQIDLHADGVNVLRHTLPVRPMTAHCGVLARSFDMVAFEDFAVSSKSRKAFVVMQYTEPYNILYEQVIEPITKDFGVESTRADETFGPGFIMADMMRQIEQSDLVIAEITPNNPNVFYEVGYAHALKKPTILIAEKGKQLPFDVSGFRTLFYENSIAGKERIEAGLREHIRAINS
jgi:Nucleoside 2-deoxyribosyltransferase